MSNSNGHVPSHWRGDLDQDSRIPRSIEAIGERPRGFDSAYRLARAAEFRVLAASSTHLAKDRDEWIDRLAEAERRSAEKPHSDELRNFVVSCKRNLQFAEEILAAAPGEAERITVATERQQRKSGLGRLREDIHQFGLRGLATPLETVEASINLTEQVEADARQVEKEQSELLAMQNEADELKSQVLGVLSRALERAVVECADTTKALLHGPRARSIATAYPTMSDPRIFASWKRAMGLALVARDVTGVLIDLDATFARVLNSEEFAAFSKVVRGSARRMVLPQVAQR